MLTQRPNSTPLTRICISLSDFSNNGANGMAAIVNLNILKRSGSKRVSASFTTEMLLAKIRVTRLISTTLLVFLGTQDATFRHAARALRLTDHRAVHGGDGSSVSWTADSRIPGGTFFHLPISSGDLFFDDVLAGGSGEFLDGGEPEAEAAGGGRNCRRPGRGVAGTRRRG